MDICANEEVILLPGQKAVVRTGIHVEIPSGYAFEVSPRSGISSKTNLLVILGTIDAQYRGELGIIVTNLSQASLSEVVSEIDEDKEYVILDDDPECPRYIELRDSSDCDPEYHGAYRINVGDRIAQLKLKVVPLCEWEVVSELSTSDRGSGGFGHTGVGI